MKRRPSRNYPVRRPPPEPTAESKWKAVRREERRLGLDVPIKRFDNLTALMAHALYGPDVKIRCVQYPDGKNFGYGMSNEARKLWGLPENTE